MTTPPPHVDKETVPGWLLRNHVCNVDARLSVGECIDRGYCGCSCGLYLKPEPSRMEGTGE